MQIQDSEFGERWRFSEDMVKRRKNDNEENDLKDSDVVTEDRKMVEKYWRNAVTGCG